MKLTKEQLKQIIKEEINEVFGFSKKEKAAKQSASQVQEAIPL